MVVFAEVRPNQGEYAKREMKTVRRVQVAARKGGLVRKLSPCFALGGFAGYGEPRTNPTSLRYAGLAGD